LWEGPRVVYFTTRCHFESNSGVMSLREHDATGVCVCVAYAVTLRRWCVRVRVRVRVVGVPRGVGTAAVTMPIFTYVARVNDGMPLVRD